MSSQVGLFEQDIHYCIDSSVIVNFLSDSEDEPYDAELFAPQWKVVELAILNGECIAPRQIENELSKWQVDAIQRWIKSHSYMFTDMSSAQLAAAKRVVNLYPAYGSDTNHLGDLELISLALAQELTVISSEIRDPSLSRRRPKIPDVCDALGVKCVNVKGFLRERGLDGESKN